MTLYPRSREDDGPVKVYLTDGNVLQYDRIRHNQSGMITLYDVERTDLNGIRKGDRARAVPVRRIEHVEWEGFGPDQ